MRRFVACVVMVAACKGGAKSNEKPAGGGSALGSAPPSASSASTLSIVQDGKPIPVENAFVKQMPDGKLQLYVGQGGSCGELLTNLFNGKNQHVLVDLPSVLNSDGTESWTVTDVYVMPPETADPGGKVNVKGTLAKGSKVDIELQFTSAAAKLEVKGNVTAESCGEPDVSTGPLPKAQHASTATMTIANKAIPIRAALVKGKNVELSDFPRDCSSAWFIGAALKRDGDWHLSGRRFAKPVDGGGDGLTVTEGAKGTSADGPTVQLTLGGAGKVGDYPVKLDGTVEALACP
jgi:hypothetical protein